MRQYVKCQCGSNLLLSSYEKHLRTYKHLKYMNYHKINTGDEVINIFHKQRKIKDPEPVINEDDEVINIFYKSDKKKHFHKMKGRADVFT